jgi:hypothetical protein
MYMLIRYPVGVIVEAVVLAMGRNRMRVVAAGFPDTIELKRTGSQWFTATWQPVEFDFLMSSARQTSSAHHGASLSSAGPSLVAGAGGNNPQA